MTHRLFSSVEWLLVGDQLPGHNRFVLVVVPCTNGPDVFIARLARGQDWVAPGEHPVLGVTH
jgi:hypothetical protein